MLNHPHYRALINPVTFQLTSTPEELFQLHRKEDMDRLMSHFNVIRLHYIGTDMATNFMKDCVKHMDDATFDL